MQSLNEESLPKTHEDVIAERILKRAQIAKLTRQLKSKLFKAGMKVRESQGKSPFPSSSPAKPVSVDPSPSRLSRYSKQPEDSPITPMKRQGKKDDIDSSSPVKRFHSGNLSSSPFYVSSSSPGRKLATSQSSVIMQTPQSLASSQANPPKTPPSSSRFATLSGVKGSAARNGTASISSKHRRTVSQQWKNGTGSNANSLLATPKASSTMKALSKEFTTPTAKYTNDNEEGAALLLYLSDSPARGSSSKDSKESSLINLPSTPKTSSSILQFAGTPTFGFDATPPRVGMLPLPMATPSGMHFGTPNSSALQSFLGSPNGALPRMHVPATPNNKVTSTGVNKTPAFSMSDYVNIFSPSPRYTRTPEMGHDFGKSLGTGQDGTTPVTQPSDKS